MQRYLDALNKGFEDVKIGKGDTTFGYRMPISEDIDTIYRDLEIFRMH